jgi:putative photosynthetic complex assembly protein 2
MQQGQPNHIALCTYALLWCMRLSAKLNLFFGVRNLSEEFLPVHLAYLQSFFRRRRLNAFYPFALALAGMALWWLVSYGMRPLASQTQVVGAVLVGTMLALAILEHLMLVLPVDTSALWRWALRNKRAADAPAL